MSLNSIAQPETPSLSLLPVLVSPIQYQARSNVPQDIAWAQEPERWVSAHWVGEVKEEFQTTLEIVADTQTGLLMEITQQFF